MAIMWLDSLSYFLYLLCCQYLIEYLIILLFSFVVVVICNKSRWMRGNSLNKTHSRILFIWGRFKKRGKRRKVGTWDEVAEYLCTIVFLCRIYDWLILHESVLIIDQWEYINAEYFFCLYTTSTQPRIWKMLMRLYCATCVYLTWQINALNC